MSTRFSYNLSFLYLGSMIVFVPSAIAVQYCGYYVNYAIQVISMGSICKGRRSTYLRESLYVSERVKELTRVGR
jgi:hypothetical protein